MRILIAEDDRIIADGLTRSLRANGYAVDCAHTGLDADTGSHFASAEFRYAFGGVEACAHW